MKAAREVKASLERLLALDEQDMNAVAAETELWRHAYADGRATAEELNVREWELAETQTRASATRTMLLQVVHLLSEAVGAERLATLPPLRKGALDITPTLVRFNGPRPWSLVGMPQIEHFFQDRFGRPLPISAFGQTAVHDRLALDHRDAVDVALHPDSAEGQALMAHLKREGIAFIAFREALAGAATGAHIHIGPPSRPTIRHVQGSGRQR